MKKSKMLLVLGLGFGDEGKGTIIDFLTRKHQIPLIVKTGGPQQAHNVVEPNGKWHCFSQFSSGTLVPGTETFISKEMIVEPGNLLREFYVLREKGEQDAIVRITIDADAAIVTPLERMVSQMKEISRGKNRFGSCGMGVGETVFDREKGLAITFRDALNTKRLRKKLKILSAAKITEAKELLKQCPSEEIISTYQSFQKWIAIYTLFRFYRNFVRTTGIPIDTSGSYLQNAIAQKTSLIFEGTQGALLDRFYGFYPHVTKTRTTFHFVERLLGMSLKDHSLRQNYDVEKVGVIRAFATRHGIGPFVTEDANLANHFKDPYNVENKWQGKLRFGWLDILAVRYGILVNEGIDYLALTNLDQLSGLKTAKFCTSYQYEGNLDILSPYFVWEPIDSKKARIIAFKKPDSTLIAKNELAQILFHCQPLEFKELAGWKENIDKATSLKELPPEARECISFLQSKEGLDVPIKIISINPTWEGKIIIKNP
jgi:adenylosuccinate synthase